MTESQEEGGSSSSGGEKEPQGEGNTCTTKWHDTPSKHPSVTSHWDV